MCFISVHLMHSYSNIDTATAWKKSHFILLNRSDCHIINKLPIAFYTFTRHILTSLSVDKMLLSWYVNWLTNFRGLLFIGPAVRVFANGPGDLGSIPGRVIPKTLKMVLDTTLLNTQHYKVRFKGKVEQSWEWSSALPYTLV